MKVSKQPPEPQEDEIQIILSREETKALAAIVGTNPTDVRERWERTFRGMYASSLMDFSKFSTQLYNKLRNIV